jgi:hypothetical protein
MGPNFIDNNRGNSEEYILRVVYRPDNNSASHIDE